MIDMRNTASTLLLGLILAGSALPVDSLANAGARPGHPSNAPKAWMDYAALVSVALQQWLDEDTEPAARLHEYFIGVYTTDKDRVPVIPLSLWIRADGVISRIEHQQFLHPQANEDLRAVIVERKLPQPPPGMLQPLRLQLRLRLTDPAARSAQ